MLRSAVGPLSFDRGPLVPVVAYLLTVTALAAYALGGLAGFEPAASRVVAHPLPYLAALASALLFTAVPADLFFRAYLQSKVTLLVGGRPRRAAVIGVVVAAVLFALFHLPRWFLVVGHGVGGALAGRLVELAIIGLAYGTVYALSGNLWVVALLHATMNQPPALVAGHVPPGLVLPSLVAEFGGAVALVAVATRFGDESGLSFLGASAADPGK